LKGHAAIIRVADGAPAYAASCSVLQVPGTAPTCRSPAVANGHRMAAPRAVRRPRRMSAPPAASRRSSAHAASQGPTQSSPGECRSHRRIAPTAQRYRGAVDRWDLSLRAKPLDLFHAAICHGNASFTHEARASSKVSFDHSMGSSGAGSLQAIRGPIPGPLLPGNSNCLICHATADREFAIADRAWRGNEVPDNGLQQLNTRCDRSIRSRRG
jgi:hypothetical protein